MLRASLYGAILDAVLTFLSSRLRASAGLCGHIGTIRPNGGHYWLLGLRCLWDLGPGGA